MNMQNSKTILLVDDDDVIASTHTTILEKEGYIVLKANNGEDAIQKALRHPCDLILMDIDLGEDIDGTEAARRILAKKEIPIVFLTSHSEKELVEKVKNITRYGYVIKNSGAFVLLSSIEMAFELFYIQRETKRKEELFELIAENTLDLIALHTVDGKFIYLSPSVEKILGYKQDELIGVSPYALFHPEDIERIQRGSHEKAKVGEDGVSITYRIQSKSGSYIWLETITKSIWDESRTNVVLLQTVSRDITERRNEINRQKDYETKLKESQARYKSMVESSLEAIFVHRNYKFIYANTAGLKLVGANSFSEIDGRSIFEFVHPEYMGQVENRVNILYTAKEKAPIKEERFFRLDKKVIDVEISANPIEFDGEFAILVIARDITERKNQEKKIREAEYRFKTLIENLEIGVIVQDANAKILINNPAAENLLGLTTDQLRGKTSFDADWNVIHEDGKNFPGNIHPVPVCIRTKKPVIDVIMGVYRPTSKDRIWLSVNAKPEFNLDGEISQVICTFQDITARIKNDQILKEKEERLRLALAAGNQGLYDLNIQTGKATVNQYYAQMLGYELDEFEESNTKWRDRLHEEDRETVLKAYTDYIAGIRKEFNVEFRQKTKDGQWKWILSQGKIVEWDNDGNPLRMIGIHTDINEKKKYELLQIARNSVLDAMIAKKNIYLILEEIVRSIEMILPDVKASILLVDKDKKLAKGASTSLPDFYNKAVEGLAIGYGVGSCGTAAYTGELVIVDNIQSHPFWQPYKELAERAGLRACWSFPFKSDSDEVLGTFATYYSKPRSPSRSELDIILEFSRITGLAVQNNLTEINRRKAEEEVKSLLAEKEILLKEVHHRIKNNMATISSLFSLQAEYVNDERVSKTFEDAQQRILSMMLIYDKLYKSSDYQNISIQEYLNDLLDHIIVSFPGGHKIKIERKIDPFPLNSKVLFSVGIIINELITNSFKYAFPEIRQDLGKIIVSAKKVNEQTIELIVEDNGVGLPEGFSTQSSLGFGLNLIRILTQKKGSCFEVISGKGATFRILLSF